jgi:prepilin-type N-terminal cleavage/methylation domain-containing protein
MVALHSPRVRLGFTMIEMLVVLAIFAILAGALGPVVARQISHSRVNGAARVIAGNLETALSLAARQRRPVRVTVDPADPAILVADRASGQLIARHAYGPMSEYKVETLSSSPASIDILPHGVVTSAATLTVGIGGYSRRVTLTRAGHVRLQP